MYIAVFGNFKLKDKTGLGDRNKPNEEDRSECGTDCDWRPQRYLLPV